MEKFPCLRLGYEAAQAGGVKPVALNAADEVAVSAFLEGTIGFDQIPQVIEDVVSASKERKLESIIEVLKVDSEARQMAGERVSKFAGAAGLKPVSAGSRRG